MDKLVLSPLGHTWIFDLDGTVLKHNGHILDGKDSFLSGAKEFLSSIPEKDMIIFLTSRNEEYRSSTEQFLKDHGIRFDCIIFGVPFGERILINDAKPSGLKTCIALNTLRNCWCNICIVEDPAK